MKPYGCASGDATREQRQLGGFSTGDGDRVFALSVVVESGLWRGRAIRKDYGPISPDIYTYVLSQKRVALRRFGHLQEVGARSKASDDGLACFVGRYEPGIYRSR